jgi:competence protein ComEC
MTWKMNDVTNGPVNFTTQPAPIVAGCIFAGGMFVLVCGCLLAVGIPTGHPADAVVISFLNIGQGDAIFVETPATRALIDAGPDESVLDELSAIMPLLGRHIYLVLASHSDADHIGGFPGVLSRYEYGIFAATGAPKTTAIRGEIDVMTASSTKWNLAAGDRVILDPYNNVFADVLWPPAAAVAAASSDDNELSLVLKLHYGSSSVLLTGDAGIPTEKELIRCFGASLASTILKVGHHGSDSSTSADFVAAVSPVVAVISAGEGNKYGHPHQSVIDTLSQALNPENIHITKDEGRVTFVLSKAGVALFP